MEDIIDANYVHTKRVCKDFHDLYVQGNMLLLNLNWLQIPDHHPYRILIIRGSGSGKTNSFFNLITDQPDIDKIYL